MKHSVTPGDVFLKIFAEKRIGKWEIYANDAILRRKSVFTASEVQKNCKPVRGSELARFLALKLALGYVGYSGPTKDLWTGPFYISNNDFLNISHMFFGNDNFFYISYTSSKCPHLMALGNSINLSKTKL